MSDERPKPKLDLATLRAVPSAVWALGIVSLLMDMSSEIIHSLLPVYLVTVLGTSALTVGVNVLILGFVLLIAADLVLGFA